MNNKPISKTESVLVDILILVMGCIGFLVFCYFLIPKVLQ